MTSHSEGHSPSLRVRTKEMLPAMFDKSQKSQGTKTCIASSLGLPDHTDVNRLNLSALKREVAKTKSGTIAIILTWVSANTKADLYPYPQYTHTHTAISDTDGMGQRADHAFAYHGQLLVATLKTSMQSGKKEAKISIFLDWAKF